MPTPPSPAPRPAVSGTAAAAAEAPAVRGSRLDDYLNLYAQRTHGMMASEIRALFAVASRPEVVSLAGGMPYVSAIPQELLNDVVSEVVTRNPATALQYGSGQGDPRLRELICTVMAEEGIAGHPDDVVVTVGSQQALDLVTRIFCDPGDVVLAEGPSYVGALSVFAAYQVEVVHVPMDGDGLVPETLADTIARMKAQGRRVKFLYTVPNFHNPAGVSLSAERRTKILEICDRAGIPILEDNPYGLLGFDGPPAAALRSVDAENVIYLGSFSKMFASGLRVGWVLAPHGVREKLVLANEAAVLCPPNFTQLVIARYLAEHDWRAQVVRFQNLYRERRDATLGALTQMMPAGTTWTKPTGGFYVWVTLPEGLDSKAMLPRAVTARVAYVPGTAFYMGEGGRREMRLSYCYPPPERIREGVRRLTGVINSELETMATFGTSSAPAEHGIERPGPQSPSPEIR